MGRRKDAELRPDPALEARIIENGRKVYDCRRALAAALDEREKLWTMAYHGHYYTQRAISELTNRSLPPGDSLRIGADGVEKVVKRARR